MSDIIIIVLLILLNGVFSMSEIALISARKARLTNDAKQGSKTAKAALALADEPDRFLSTVQIGITLIGILTGIYSGDTLADDLVELLAGWGISGSVVHSLSQLFIIVIVTYLSIVVGELVPKRIGMNVADTVAKIVAVPMKFLSTLASPFVWLLSKSTSVIVKLLGLSNADNKVTEEEIKSIIQEGTEAGEVQEVEQDIVERVFLMGDLKVSSIMTHRSDLVSIPADATVEEIENVIEESPFDAYPVTEGDMETIKGMVFMKDLALKLGKHDFNLESIMRPVVYFPENTSVYKLLEQLKAAQVNRAIICDEFGSVEGIVTLRDIFEGLVGSIEDQPQDPDIVERKEGDGWLVDGQCQMYDFLEHFDMEELYEQKDYHTIGGLVLDTLERIPAVGETIEWQGFKLEVVDMDGVRIDKILVTKIND